MVQDSRASSAKSRKQSSGSRNAGERYNKLWDICKGEVPFSRDVLFDKNIPPSVFLQDGNDTSEDFDDSEASMPESTLPDPVNNTHQQQYRLEGAGTENTSWNA